MSYQIQRDPDVGKAQDLAVKSVIYPSVRTALALPGIIV